MVSKRLKETIILTFSSIYMPIKSTINWVYKKVIQEEILPTGNWNRAEMSCSTTFYPLINAFGIWGFDLGFHIKQYQKFHYYF